jgi:hypothetical protein
MGASALAATWSLTGWSVLDDWLATDQGRHDHGEDQDMTATIDTFQMYDLEPVSGRL